LEKVKEISNPLKSVGEGGVPLPGEEKDVYCKKIEGRKSPKGGVSFFGGHVMSMDRRRKICEEGRLLY